jgi:type II secretory pathway component GspD/PulD (secretin)
MYRDKKRNDRRGIRKKLFVWSLAVIAMTATAAAGAAAAAPPQIIEKFDVEEEFGVRKALAMLGNQCQKNIVPSPSVDGVLAFRSLRNVTFEEAMDAILGDNFKYEQDGKLIKVYTKDEYKKLKEDPARMEDRVFTLYYITADEADKLIAPVLSGSASAKIAKSTAAEKTISSGSTGGTSGTGSSSGSGGSGDKMALNDTIVIHDYPENLERAAEVIKSIDIRPQQVLVEATILSAVLTEDTKFGIDWNFMAGVSLTGTSSVGQIGTTESIGTTSTSPISQIAASTAGAPIETAGFATSGMNGLRIGATSGDMAVFITALEKITDVTIMANPKILAVNKQEGSVHIGKTLGYRGSTAISTGGVATQGEVQFLDTGTVLVFRPYIGNDGYIRMDIYPQDSTAQLNIDRVPDKTTAEIKTNVLVKDGETIVIGGLFRDVVTTTRSQVPILGDLPLVGIVFRGTSDTTERQEVIVLLTPHIIKEAGEVDGQARAADIRRKRFGAKDGLQWMDRAKLAEDHYAKAVSSYKEHDTITAMEQVSAALNLRPTYLEAIRLKERIIAEATPEEVQQMERIMLESVDQKEAPKWQRK